MLNDIVVSVSMITYKHEAYIAQAINGVLMQQTNFEYELIVADDSSPDKTERVVLEIINSHPKGHLIRYFRHKENLGMHSNGIFATQQCRGKYIAICEGDDYWTDPLKLHKQVEFLEANSGCGLIYSNYNSLRNNELIPNSSLNMNYPTLSSYFQDDLKFIYTGSWVMRNCLDDYTPLKSEVVLPGDVQVVCYLLNLGFKVKYQDEVMGVYRVLPESASHSDLNDKNLSFVLVKYFLVEKYKSTIDKDVYNYIWEKLIERNFKYFSHFSLTTLHRFRLFSKIRLSKGIARTLKYVLLNNSK